MRRLLAEGVEGGEHLGGEGGTGGDITSEVESIERRCSRKNITLDPRRTSTDSREVRERQQRQSEVSAGSQEGECDDGL